MHITHRISYTNQIQTKPIHNINKQIKRRINEAMDGWMDGCMEYMVWDSFGVKKVIAKCCGNCESNENDSN